jgi:hypothetical protein
MTAPFKGPGLFKNAGLCLSVFTVLILAQAGLPVHAQIPGSTSPSTSSAPTPPANANAGPRQEHGDWKNEKFERQEFREEMEKIRKEHEELESARDKLLDQCGGGKQNLDPAECEKQRQMLHDWHDRLHERMRVLREKMDEMRRAHPENGIGSMPGGNRPWPHANSAPPANNVPLNNGTPSSGIAPASPPTQLPPVQ